MRMTLFRSTRSLAGRSLYRSFSSEVQKVDEDIAMLEKLLKEAKSKRVTLEPPKSTVEEGEETNRKFVIGTFNAVSPIGLKRFDEHRYTTQPLENFVADGVDANGPHAILLRSFKLKNEHVPRSVRAIARCGAGVNNIEVAAMSNRGIPVFNSPGANANAVKELVVCSLLLASRGVVQGINHLTSMVDEESKNFEVIKPRVEKDKKMFKGVEIYGKKLGVIGLGHIGAAVADAALALGMDVVGYDPTLGVDAAWRLPGHILKRSPTIAELVKDLDYISLHTPYMKETHHLIDKTMLELMPSHCSIINFARGELVDTAAVKELVDSGKRSGMYVADFADEYLYDCKKAILVPHLGASTEEAEDNSAEMAANQVRDFIETGSVRNSVNFPTIELPRPRVGHSRLCIVNRNVPGMLGLITTTLGAMGLNIKQHINNSRGDLAYNVVDLDVFPEKSLLINIQTQIGNLEGVISSRLILNKIEPNFFVVNEAEV